MVLFLTGHIKTSDGTVLPNDATVQRVCNQNVRQQVYASFHGDFSMQMGSPINDSFIDASGDPGAPQMQSRRSVNGGIPRSELQKCELRATASGFRPGTMSLVDLTPSGDSVDVGAILIERVKKVEGATLSATPYKASDKARKAYEKGLDALQKNKLPDAQRYFEQAVAIYPRYVSGWYQLGAVLQKQDQNDPARSAYLRATTLDPKYPPPFVALAAMAFQERNWDEVIRYTNHVIELDPWNRTNLTGYVVDFDPLKSAEAYYLNAVANYMLDKADEAEKSVNKALHLDLLTNYPQAHLLMAQIYSDKKNYPGAISELQTYLQLVPSSPPGDTVHQQLAELQKLNGSVPSTEKTDRK
jgi:Tfp pilus assembly protein PilF